MPTISIGCRMAVAIPQALWLAKLRDSPVVDLVFPTVTPGDRLASASTKILQLLTIQNSASPGSSYTSRSIASL
jgi:hypothetical protein